MAVGDGPEKVEFNTAARVHLHLEFGVLLGLDDPLGQLLHCELEGAVELDLAHLVLQLVGLHGQQTRLGDDALHASRQVQRDLLQLGVQRLVQGLRLVFHARATTPLHLAVTRHSTQLRALPLSLLSFESHSHLLERANGEVLSLFFGRRGEQIYQLLLVLRKLVGETQHVHCRLYFLQRVDLRVQTQFLFLLFFNQFLIEVQSRLLLLPYLLEVL